MENTPTKREEVLKVLEMMEQGKIDQDRGLSLIAMLEGKDIIGGVHGVVRDGNPQRKRWGWVGGLLGAISFIAFIYGLFFYLPVHAEYNNMLLVYGLVALIILCGALIAVSAISVGRLAVKKHG